MSSTIRNYIKATKLFCQVNDLVLNWDKVRHGLIHAMQSANDGAPTIDDNNTVISSGIRIGSDYLRWKRVAPGWRFNHCEIVSVCRRSGEISELQYAVVFKITHN